MDLIIETSDLDAQRRYDELREKNNRTMAAVRAAKEAKRKAALATQEMPVSMPVSDHADNIEVPDREQPEPPGVPHYETPAIPEAVELVEKSPHHFNPIEPADKNNDGYRPMDDLLPFAKNILKGLVIGGVTVFAMWKLFDLIRHRYFHDEELIQTPLPVLTIPQLPKKQEEKAFAGIVEPEPQPITLPKPVDFFQDHAFKLPVVLNR